MAVHAAIALLAFTAVFVLSGARGRELARQAPVQRTRALAGLLAGLPASASAQKRRLKESCLADMPAMLDLVTLGLSAGLSFDAALELYCARYRTPLSESFKEALLSWRIGECGRAEALERLAQRLDSPAMTSFSSVVTEALAFGTPLAGALESQAALIRDEQRSELEEKIERVPVKMLIPLGTLIVPAMLLAILGPLLGPAVELG